MVQQIWVQEITVSLQELGGEGSLLDIYKSIENRANIYLDDYTDWKSRVRNNIYLHSSDTEIFRGKANDSTDLFYSVKGKGKGMWGLRGYK